VSKWLTSAKYPAEEAVENIINGESLAINNVMAKAASAIGLVILQ